MATPPLMDTTLLAQAVAIADQGGSAREAAAALRAHFTAMRVVVVGATDMCDETPAAIGARHRLYFAASDGHCWRVTAEPADAVGFFISDRD